MKMTVTGGKQVPITRRQQRVNESKLKRDREIDLKLNRLVPLKKVCQMAGDIDHRLARRILRSKAKKPSGRWEWRADEVQPIVDLLRKEVANGRSTT